MKIGIINGPNLNLLGSREPKIYGSQPFEDYLDKLREEYDSYEFFYRQSNVEGELVNAVQELAADCNFLIVNAAAYSHTSIAIADAVSAVHKPVIEVHISNIYKRENFRQHSYLSPYVAGIISGFGIDVYRLAVEAGVGKV